MLSSTEFAAYCGQARLCKAAVEYISAVRAGPPSRRVGDTARHNVCARIPSSGIGLTVQAESRTCEAAFVYESELSPEVLEIWDQPIPLQIRRNRGAKGTHVASYTPDFLVLRKAGPALVECKPYAALQKNIANKPDEWSYSGGVPRYLPAHTAAERLGLPHELYVADDTASRHLANLEFLHALQLNPAVNCPDEMVQRILARLHGAPTILELCSAKRGPAPSIVYQLLAESKIFGALRAQLLTQQDVFRLFANRSEAYEFQAQLLQAYRATPEKGGETALAALLSATPRELAHANETYAGIQEVLAGVRKPTRNEYRYLQRISNTSLEAAHPLAACLPRFSDRGNRVPRLTTDQERIVESVIKTHWTSGICKDRSQLLGHVDSACTRHGVQKISKSTLRTRCSKVAPEQVALGRLGVRGYHSTRPPVSAEHATLRCEIPGLIGHVDSTQFDGRVWSECELAKFCEPPWLYVFYDEATSRALGAWIGFGKSDRFGLFLAFRDLVRRQGRLPPYMLQDRGSEYGSVLWEQLQARFNITKYSRPSSAPRFGGLAESALKQINFRIANRLAGATWADQRSRQASGAKKSRATARLELAVIIGEFRNFEFEEFNKTTHGDADGCPDDLWHRGELEYGQVGQLVNIDLPFLIATSVAVDVRLGRQKGLRCGYREYWTEELNQIRRPYKLEEARLDPDLPSTLYVKCKGNWLICHSRDHNALLPLSNEGRFFENYRVRSNSRTSRTEGRHSHERIARRIEQIEASHAATASFELSADQPRTGTTSKETVSNQPEDASVDLEQYADISFSK
ncbi:TnsA endonuclease N-terminal domain-containing protein [Dyella ginsengisoli]|uniref:TnsA endonuclease N-terminal domain-containing protein n=1 Tax=Dyella ginsengisoli TaxID=363848 RepID=UPI00034BCA77|nr:TnsA endonuclease N-terminal domain-containing protein [Dyella ginsengisoli]